MLKYLTLTGIDEHTDVGELVKLQSKYPLLEFGVLVSQNNTGVAGHNRYPSLERIREFADAGLHLSCHFCGGIARKTMSTGDFSEMLAFIGDLLPFFQRMQFNINGCICSSLFDYKGEIPLIIQAGTEAGRIFYTCMNVHNRGGMIQGLIDSSGGRGTFSGKFDVSTDAREFVGYAGGIGVDNVASVLTDLRSKLGDKDFWIDMESSVRDADNWFDIEKARAICEVVFGGN